MHLIKTARLLNINKKNFLFQDKADKIRAFNKNNVSYGLSSKGYGHTYFAQRAFKPSEVVMMGFGRIIDHQTSHKSVQIDYSKHYLPDKWTGAYWDHSCSPNTYIHTRVDGFPNLIALKNIKKGEEITYAYWMTEYEWSKGAKENTIRCKCGEKDCRGKILSFTQLSNSEKTKLLNKQLCSKYLSTPRI